MPAFGAVLGSSITTTAGGKTVTATPTLNDLIILVTIYSDGTAGGAAVSDNNSDGGGSYTKIAGTTFGATVKTCDLWVRNARIGSATSTVFTLADPPGSDTGSGITVGRWTGFSDAGAGIVRQSSPFGTFAAAATPAATFPVAALTGNSVIAVAWNASSTPTLTPPASYTERLDAGYSSPTCGIEYATRDSGETGTTITWGSTSPTQGVCIVAELQATAPPEVRTWRGVHAYSQAVQRAAVRMAADGRHLKRRGSILVPNIWVPEGC